MPSTTQDIIQRFRVTGDQEVTSAFKRIADTGSAAFTTIANAASKLSAPFVKTNADLAQVEQRANTFGRAIANVGGQVASAATRLTAAAGIFAAAGGLMLKGVSNISTALGSVSAALIDQRAALKQHTTEAKQDLATQFQQANALEDLRRQWTTGKISIEDYSASLVELRRTQQRELDQQAAMRVAAEDLREEQSKAAAEADKRAIQIKLEAQYGGALASQLQVLANVLDNLKQRFLGAFGPQVSSFMSSLIQSIQDAAPKILAAFQKMSADIEAAFKKSGVTVDSVVSALVEFGTAAATTVVKFIIPAFQAFMDILNKVADIINSIFGTKFTGISLVAIAIVLKLTGVFGALVGIVQLIIAGVGLLAAAFSPLTIIIIAVVAALALLWPVLQKIDWAGWAKTAQDAWTAIKDAVGSVADAVVAAWTGVVNFFKNAIASIIGFFNDLIRKVKEFLGLTGSTGGGQLASDLGINDIGGFAKGGLFRGLPGRDSNLAWLTDKEFIINPKATKYWGTNFLHAINSMVNPIRGFAEGGLNSLSSPMPRVAFAGGSTGRATSRPLTLVIGDQEFAGLTVEDNTAESMARYATRRGVRSAGRRPLWFGGTK